MKLIGTSCYLLGKAPPFDYISFHTTEKKNKQVDIMLKTKFIHTYI